jgi:aminopeptidase YwaD
MRSVFLFIGTIFFLSLSIKLRSQDLAYSRKIVDTLTSEYFFGRGYVHNGMGKAAQFLKHEFEALGLKPLNGENHFQSFQYPVNSYPGKLKLKMGKRILKPGVDFLISPDSKAVKARGKLLTIDSVRFLDPKHKVLFNIVDKLTWSVSQKKADHTLIQLKKEAVSSFGKYSLKVDQQFLPEFKADNVCALVKGYSKPDSFIFITAHYDHLGGMGAHTYFPGANDNASGIALLLNLAKYYAANPQPYSIAFICFAGEEAGLVGSKFFTEHPQVPLDRIRFLINLDLAGTGGITVVNATEWPKAFQSIVEINDSLQLLKQVKSRGKAANSDHYFFAEKDVPSFFIYTMGGISAYHDVYDISATLPLTEQADLFRLVSYFIREIQNNN